MSTSEHELLRIETFVLKVHMNCQGCMNKVRKVLRKIDGVYTVDIKAEEQKVIVMGNVNLSTLVHKLAKFGKHAEIWNTGYAQEQLNLVEDNNKSQAQYMIDEPNAYEDQYSIQAQYIIDEPNAYEDQYSIPAFDRDQWELQWYLNQHKGARDVEREISQHLGEPLFLNNVNHISHQYFPRMDENPKWKESMILAMMPTSFQENNGTYYSHLGSQQCAWNLHGVSPIDEYGNQPSPMGNVYGYYHNYLPSKAMQQCYYNHLPQEINFQ